MRTLSKSKLLAFRQCPKRLWLEIHRPALRENSASTEASFRVGHQVGDIARRIYDPAGTGVLVDPKSEGFDAALKRSTTLLGSEQPIFEAGYAANGALALADVMLPVLRDGRHEWRMVEVKSSTSVKDYHREDAAIQAFVAKSAGVPLAAIAVAHIDSTWVYGGDSDYAGLLVERDLSEEAFGRGSEVEQWIASAQAVGNGPNEPINTTGAHCTKPFECGFIGYCQSQEPQSQHPVSVLPGRRSNALQSYITEENVTELRDIPDALLNDRQLRVKTHTLSGEVFFDAKSAAAALAKYTLPICFLDFESIQFAVPIWKNTRPYQQLPFQFSLHRLTDTGAIEHNSFLDLSGSDPSKTFAEALIDACRNWEPVFVYNASFEKGRITELADRFAALSGPLLAINARIVDLLPIAQRYYYHPSQEGSWGLKAVLPAVIPDLDHQSLDGVKDGGMAMGAFLEAIHKDTSIPRKQQLKQQLLDYCRLDTYALVRIWQVFAGPGNS